MNKDVLEPHHIKTVVLDLLASGQRQLSWDLIDHYYQKASRLDHFDVLGYVSMKASKRDTYLKCAEAAYSLAQTPDQLFRARSNLYRAYNALNYPEKALFYIEQNLLFEPDDVDTRCQKVFNLSLMGEKQKAEALLLEIVEENKHQASKFQGALSSKHLREGNTAKGILSFVENDKPVNRKFETHLGMKKWNGLINPGKTLYVDIEGGIGDNIINIRFFDRLSSYGMNPVLVSESSDHYNDMNSLLRRHGYNVLTDTLMIDRTQTWVPMMSLPGYMGVRESQLWNGTYLKPLRQEKNKLQGTRPKIGIKCSGNPFFDQDEYRKIPIEQIVGILPSDVDVYYIDKEAKNYPGVIDLSSRINSWEDTLDFIDQMDCIVSSCTSLVHAAGAIGKTTFVAVPIAEYYIWTTSKTDGSSPWYGDNFYVARQTKVRDWQEPLADIGSRVNKLLGV